MRPSLVASALFVFLAAILAWSVPLLAEDEPAPPPVPPQEEVPEEAPAPAAASPADEVPTPEGARPLHKVYVPYRDLARIFEKEDEGVFLPYAEFLELWKKARRVEGERPGAPVPAALREASYEGRVVGDVVQLDATLEVDVLADGWQRIPLDFGGAGIERAQVGAEDALIVSGEKGRPVLLLEGKGRRTLKLRLRIPATREGDRRAVAFEMPPVPLSRLTLDVPGGAAEVGIEPQVAFSTEGQPNDTTRVLAFLGPVGKVQIGWRPKVEEGPTAKPLVFAEIRHDVRLAPGVLRTESVLELSVLRAPLGKLTLAVPADAVTLYVQADGLRTWRRSPDGTRIDLELREPAKEHWQVRLGLERPLPPLPADVSLPLVGVEGVERETGFLRLLAGEGVKAEGLDTPGLRQVDVSELPKALRGGKGRSAAWRFATRPGNVTFRVEALEPRVDVALGQRVTVRTEDTTLAVAASLDVSRAGIFDVAFLLPADLDVTEVKVTGQAAYDDHKVRVVDGERRLRVAFRDRLLGQALVTILGRRSTPLAAEDAENAWSELDVPLLQPIAADHVRGYVALCVEPALEHKETKRDGLVELDASAPHAQAPPPARGPQPPLARRYEHHAAAIDLVVALRRRDPAIKAGVETTLRLEPDRMRVGVTLRYDVRFRGVDTFRFSAPLAIADLLNLDLEGVQLLGPEPIEREGQESVRGIWTVKLPAKRMGPIPLPLEVEDVPDASLASGSSRAVAIPTFVPVEADGKPLPNVVHNIAIRRDPLLEVQAETLERIEEIDPRELPAPLRSDEDFLALRAYEPTWTASLVVTRHDYEPVAEVVVSHMHLETVVHGDRATTEAYFVVRNNDRQNLALRLPDDASIRGVTVDGQSRTPRRQDGRVLVPLPSGLGKDEAFVVAVSYDHAVGFDEVLFYETWRLQTPVPENVTADLLTWRVYLPEDREITSTGGSVEPVEPETSWFSNLVDALFQTFGRRAQAANVEVQRAASGFVSPFAMSYEGKKLLFSNRVGTGEVEITAAKPESLLMFSLLFFALALIGMGLLLPVAGRIGLGEGRFWIAGMLIVFVLLVRANPGDTRVLNAVLYGFLVAGLFRLGKHALVAGRERSEAREAVRAEADAASEADAKNEPEDVEDAEGEEA